MPLVLVELACGLGFGTGIDDVVVVVVVDAAVAGAVVVPALLLPGADGDLVRPLLSRFTPFPVEDEAAVVVGASVQFV